MAKRGSKYGILLMVLLFILFIIPGLFYLIFHPINRVVTLILLLLCGLIPGILYLLLPGGFNS